MDLNEQQRRVVEAPPGRILCSAGPGSGKTATIIAKIIHEIKTGRVRPDQILAMTFTRKAAKEMKDRLTKGLGRIADQVSVGTIHSWCSKYVIRYDPYWFGFKDKALRVISDYEDILKCLPIDAATQETFGGKPGIAREFVAHVSKGLGLPLELQEIFDSMRTYQFNSGVITCDDILFFAHKRLKEDEKFREHLGSQYKLVICDECQDNSIQQTQIALFLSEKNQNLIMVGDEHQSIYGWRNAVPSQFIKLAETFNVYLLEYNYRSTSPIIDLANEIIKVNPKPSNINKIIRPVDKTPNPSIPKLKLFYPRYDRGKRAETESEWIAKTIARKINEGKKPGDIAILCRSVNVGSAKYIQGELLARKIKYVVVGGADLANNKHVRMLFSAFSIASGIKHREDWVDLLTLSPGIGEKTAIKVAEKSPSVPDMIAAFPKSKEDARNKFQALTNCISFMRANKNDVPRCVERFAGWYLDVLRDREEDQASLDKMFKNYDIIVNSSAGLDLMETLENFTLETDENEDAKNKKDEYVVISTIHRAKGLEWPVVIIPDVYDGNIPHRNSRKESEMQEECRVFYVAVTRAKRELFMTTTITDETPILSRFLLLNDIHESFVERL